MYLFFLNNLLYFILEIKGSEKAITFITPFTFFFKQNLVVVQIIQKFLRIYFIIRVFDDFYDYSE